MKIKQLAEAAEVPVDTIRHYEKAGLMPSPSRQANNYRDYDASALQRLLFIRNCRVLDMSLDEVRTLLDFLDQPHGDCSPVDAMVAEHLGHVRERLKSLRQLERQLMLLQQACGHAEPHEVCGVVLALNDRRRPAAVEASAHGPSVHCAQPGRGAGGTLRASKPARRVGG